MIDKQSRREIMKRLGEAVDELVEDLYSEITDGVSTVQEAEISSRLCQRLEDKLDNAQAGAYIFRVIAQSVPDRGPKSLENVLGADIFLSVSLDGEDGFDKGIFIQAKYDRNINRSELIEACDKMQRVVGKEGSYVWIYEPDGVKVLSVQQVRTMKGNSLKGLQPRTVEGFTGRILDCYAGSRGWGISPGPNRRRLVADRLRSARAANILDVNLKRVD